MKAFLILIGAAIAISVQAQTEFYGGDPDGRASVASQVNGSSFKDVRVYDDFTLTAATTFDGVYGNFQDLGTVRGSSLSWEIRSGVSAGIGGSVVVAATSSSATAALSALQLYGTNKSYLYNAAVSQITLGPGTYFLSVAVDGGDGNIFLEESSGTNGLGGPLNNGNSFINSPLHSINFANTTSLTGQQTSDFSMGLHSVPAPVPEPASIAAIGLGVFAMIRRRKA